VNTRPVLDRLSEKFEIDHETGCWEWTAATSRGYGVITRNQRLTGAHRTMYCEVVEEVPGHLHVDHLCRNTRCVNPDHLEPVPPKVNIWRGREAIGKPVRVRDAPVGDEYLSTTEVCTVLQIHPSGVSRLVKLGRLTPLMKLPGLRGAFLFAPAEVARFQDTQASA
jgi:hypothetical protein